MLRGASLLRTLSFAKDGRFHSICDAFSGRGQAVAGTGAQCNEQMGIVSGTRSPQNTQVPHHTSIRPVTTGPDPAPSSHTNAEPETGSVLEPRVVKLYKGPWIRTVAFVMRVKVIQLVATGAAALPLLLHLKGEAVATGEIIGSGLLTSFAGLASWALWFYGQRFIGELALVYLPASQLQTGKQCAENQPGRSPQEQPVGSEPLFVAQGTSEPDKTMCLQFSTLDFWGKRQDELMELSKVESPLAGLCGDQESALAAAAFVPLSVRGDKQYLLSLRHGSLLQKRLLLHVLRGEWGAARAHVDALDGDTEQPPP